jgi:hypothetical protein
MDQFPVYGHYIRNNKAALETIEKCKISETFKNIFTQVYSSRLESGPVEGRTGKVQTCSGSGGSPPEYFCIFGHQRTGISPFLDNIYDSLDNGLVRGILKHSYILDRREFHWDVG